VAETTDQSSAHLTLGLLAITWHRVARRAIDDAVAAGGFRSSIPLGTLEPDGWDEAADVAPRRDPPANPGLGDLDVDLTSLSVRRWVANEIWSRQAATRLRPRLPVDAEVADGPLAVSPGPLVTLSRSGDRSVLFVGDRTISMPDEAHPFLAAILTGRAPFRRRDLPGLDDASSSVVVRRLLDEGLLVAAAEAQRA
jgi:hypothetical protein